MPPAVVDRLSSGVHARRASMGEQIPAVVAAGGLDSEAVDSEGHARVMKVG
jgi:hypothetical protein